MTEASYRDLTAGLDPQQVAEAVGAGMYEHDHCAQHLGIRLLEIAPGYAKMEMVVRRDMLNGFAICHGGIVTTLADTAFAYSCNSYNEMTVASGLATEFLAPVREGDVLTAEGREVALAGRTGVYDVGITNQRGELVAVMRGKSYRLKGRAVVELD